MNDFTDKYLYVCVDRTTLNHKLPVCVHIKVLIYQTESVGHRPVYLHTKPLKKRDYAVMAYYQERKDSQIVASLLGYLLNSHFCSLNM